ncbi:MAG TPA: hypothetical protein VMS17_01945 [Gemmataceae bacterium]|nr:hypothetical protein [Gemmataceae bacterium]
MIVSSAHQTNNHADSVSLPIGVAESTAGTPTCSAAGLPNGLSIRSTPA